MDFKKFLNEEQKTGWEKYVSKVAAECKWDYQQVTEFVYELLTDINFHSEAKRVKKFMEDLD